MVYKIGTITDLATLPPMDNTALELVYYHASVLTHEYGANRNVNESDGGFVLYATPGTNVKDIKAFFSEAASTFAPKLLFFVAHALSFCQGKGHQKASHIFLLG